jgi:hypothetical protein
MDTNNVEPLHNGIDLRELVSVPAGPGRTAALAARVRQLEGDLRACQENAHLSAARYALIKAIGQTEALGRSVVSVLRLVTESEDGQPSPAEGLQKIMEEAMIAVCRVHTELLGRALKCGVQTSSPDPGG